MSRGAAPVARTLDSAARLRIVRELHELIAALDRRVPQVERVGEVAIAKAASGLRDQALKRIDRIEAEARSTPRSRG